MDLNRSTKNGIAYVYEKPKFDFEIKDHVELAESLGLIDYQRAAKVSGHGTWFYTGLGAQLEWALLNFFISEHLKDNFTMMLPPHMLNYKSGFTAGQFPKFEQDVFELKDLECYIKFRINILNNIDEKYSCNIGFYLPINDVFEGNSIKARTLEENKYKFFCEG